MGHRAADYTGRRRLCFNGGPTMLYPLARAALFRLEPETAHALSLAAIARAGAVAPVRAALGARFRAPDAEPVEAFGLRFPNRVGLAAGYDKDGEGWRGLAALGFGHIEIGTVTPEPQPGNPRPRVFRLVDRRSVVNRMGFPGQGAARVATRLAGERPWGVVLGVNIGKQKTTPLEAAAGDYERLIEVFAPLADYLAVNISSPNTPGLRRLQDPVFLGALLGRLAAKRAELADATGRRTPILVKLAPDLDPDQLRGAVDAIVGAGLDGIIATNTTIARDAVAGHPLAAEEGGLSGAALSELSTRVVAAIAGHLGGALPVIGVGGIMSAADARAKLEAGATLVQLYTGLVYEGPGLVRRVLEGLGPATRRPGSRSTGS
ncbi:MAG: quinone-dependent dihydroorotate dehydrogenase [Thermoanaerobaculales bacterium]|nr:quinone-dependent dihydroorotate dehydrogenase [Thermoanaerobaculales bacterium]